MPYDPNNVFAKILRGELPCVKVYEDEHTLAFMDIMPQTQGHTVVIPKEAARDMMDLSPEGAARLMQSTQKIARAAKTALAASAVTLIQRSGRDSGQTVFHVHFNVMPHYPRRAAEAPRAEHGRPQDVGADRREDKSRAVIVEHAILNIKRARPPLSRRRWRRRGR